MHVCLQIWQYNAQRNAQCNALESGYVRVREREREGQKKKKKKKKKKKRDQRLRLIT